MVKLKQYFLSHLEIVKDVINEGNDMFEVYFKQDNDVERGGVGGNIILL